MSKLEHLNVSGNSKTDLLIWSIFPQAIITFWFFVLKKNNKIKKILSARAQLLECPKFNKNCSN